MHYSTYCLPSILTFTNPIVAPLFHSSTLPVEVTLAPRNYGAFFFVKGPNAYRRPPSEASEKSEAPKRRTSRRNAANLGKLLGPPRKKNKKNSKKFRGSAVKSVRFYTTHSKTQAHQAHRIITVHHIAAYRSQVRFLEFTNSKTRTTQKSASFPFQPARFDFICAGKAKATQRTPSKS